MLARFETRRSYGHYLSDGVMLEWLYSHSNVLHQPPLRSRMHSGINPYALGFAMYRDIQRICQHPTEKDRRWFPDLAGKPWQPALDHAMRDHKDESFVGQFLSPRLMRDMRLFSIHNDEQAIDLELSAIHDEAGYLQLRQALSEQYELGTREPNIQVWNVNLRGDRTLVLRHSAYRDRPLGDSTLEVLRHTARLWAFGVRLESVNAAGEVTRQWNVAGPA
jgi:stage V sporulation protein R